MKRSILGTLMLGGVMLMTQANAKDIMIGGDGVSQTPVMNVGGYSVADATTPDVIEVAHAAVAKKRNRMNKMSLIQVLSAKTQVVAGFNYDLILAVNVAGKTRYAHTVVYHSLKNTKIVREWHWMSKAKVKHIVGRTI